MTGPSVDERTLLETLAAFPGPFSLDDAFEVALPPRPTWPRMGGRRRYGDQWMATMRAFVSLGRAGLLVVCDGVHLYAITDAGREALGGAKGLT